MAASSDLSGNEIRWSGALSLMLLYGALHQGDQPLVGEHNRFHPAPAFAVHGPCLVATLNLSAPPSDLSLARIVHSSKVERT